MSVVRIGTEEITHVHMQQRVLIEEFLVTDSFLCRGKSSLDEKIGNFDEVALFDKVRDVITAITENSFLAIYIADGRQEKLQMIQAMSQDRQYKSRLYH